MGGNTGEGNAAFSMALELLRETRAEVSKLREHSAAQATAVNGLSVQVHHLTQVLDKQSKYEERIRKLEDSNLRIITWASAWSSLVGLAAGFLMKYIAAS